MLLLFISSGYEDLWVKEFYRCLHKSRWVEQHDTLMYLLKETVSIIFMRHLLQDYLYLSKLFSGKLWCDFQFLVNSHGRMCGRRVETLLCGFILFEFESRNNMILHLSSLSLFYNILMDMHQMAENDLCLLF